jgi:hypothetical protein
VVWINGQDVHHTEITWSKHEVSIDALSVFVIDTSDFTICAGRHWGECLEFYTWVGIISDTTRGLSIIGRLT